MREIPVPEGLAGERIDVALGRLLGFSRTRASEMVDGGEVVVDGARVSKSRRLAVGNVIGLRESDQGSPSRPNQVAALPIVWRDEDLVVIDKPLGVAAHASPGWTGPTVTDSLAADGFRLASGGVAERQGVVHRLDVGTTGLMVVALSDVAYSSLKDQFRSRAVDKEYHAIVHGLLDPVRGTIDAPIGRHPTKDYRWAVVTEGKPSITHYDTIEAWPRASLVEVNLETGRTHQIRVHMAAMRHPCVGDAMYGADPSLAEKLRLTRQWLHARRLSFDHPRSGERLEFTSPYPEDLRLAKHTLEVGLPG